MSGPQALVTRAEFARICGVNRSTVTRWIENGRIQATESGLIDPAAASRMREATESLVPMHQARKAGFELAKQAPGAAQSPSGAHHIPPMPENEPGADDETEAYGLPASDVNGRYKLAMAIEREAKAELAAMEVDKQAGLLVERAEVDYVLADLANTLRGTFESLPDRLAGQLAALRGDTNAMHKALEETLRDVLASLAEQMKRRMSEVGQ